MKIAYIVSMVSGLEAFIYREVDELYKKGSRIHLFATKFKEGDMYAPKKEWSCYRFKPIKTLLHYILSYVKNPFLHTSLLFEAIKTQSLIDLIIATDFSDEMMKNGITQIHAHFGDHKFFIGYYCKKILNIPLSLTIHAHGIFANPNYTLFRKAIVTCDKVIAISEKNKQILINDFNVQKDKVEVIRLFVDSNRNISNKTKYVLTVGRFTDRKGFDVLFDAASKLSRDDVVFIVVGFGPMDLQKEAKKRDIEDRVIIYNKMDQNQLSFLYKKCDIFCLPSKTTKKEGTEGIPVVLMEAMYYEKPVIATNIGSISELVEDILIDEKNSDQLVSALNQLLDDETLRLDMGKKNKKIVEEKYSKKNVDTLYNLFNEI